VSGDGSRRTSSATLTQSTGQVGEAIAGGIPGPEILILARTGYATQAVQLSLARAGIPHRAPGRAGPRRARGTPAPANRDQLFLDSSLVVLDTPHRRLEDLAPAAEVAPEHDRRMVGVALGELDDVRRIRASEPVHYLVIIGNDGDVAVGSGEEEDEFGLRAVDVLELVDEQPSPPRADPVKTMRVLAQQPDTKREQIVEIPGVRAPELEF
jgi:hypothetical protein